MKIAMITAHLFPVGMEILSQRWLWVDACLNIQVLNSIQKVEGVWGIDTTWCGQAGFRIHSVDIQH